MSLNQYCLIFFISLAIRKAITLAFTLENTTNIEQTMLADIKSAFKGITQLMPELMMSDAMLQSKIIPEMYNFTRSHKFIFKIPDSKSKLGFAMYSTDRMELVQPIFPNITMNSEQVMLKRERFQTTVRNTQSNQSKATHNVTLSISNADVWSSLGLDGWSGELTSATDLLESEHKDAQHVKPHKNTFQNISNTTKTQMESMEVFSNKTIGAKFESITKTIFRQTTTQEDLSDNIYIARVNDPFGVSTKWAYRNQTDDAINANAEDIRQKRDVIELYSMLKCATGCEPLLYQSYGCFCGFLGNGIAVDGIDSCCRMHDKCYEQANCVSYLQYFVPYIWKCYRGKPLCALDHGSYGGPTSCAALLCYCDLRLSICLRKYHCPMRKAVCTTSFARKLQNYFF